MKILFGALLLLSSAPVWAAPASIEPAAARLFERAARVYGDAATLALDYQTSCNYPQLVAPERGSIRWRQPDFYAQSFEYSAGSGHFAADPKAIYFTQIDGQSGRFGWKSKLGFWGFLPWELPGHLQILLRGGAFFSASMPNLRVSVLPAQTIDGALCDGVLLDERARNGDSTRFWFERATGVLRRESWSVKLPDCDQFAQVQTRYFNVRLNPKLERADFVSDAEAVAPMGAAPDAR